MKVIIVGAGIGGLALAVACRQENLEVVVLERAPALEPVGDPLLEARERHMRRMSRY